MYHVYVVYMSVSVRAWCPVLPRLCVCGRQRPHAPCRWTAGLCVRHSCLEKPALSLVPSPNVQVDEDQLPLGAALHASVALRYLSQGGPAAGSGAAMVGQKRDEL